MHTATCRSSVARAFYEMLDHGVSAYGALDAAARVYRYHHPNETMRAARFRVEEWLNVRVLQ
jgi:hypothetical protein